MRNQADRDRCLTAGAKGLANCIVALVPDAFGGRGGIAHYNRMLLKALCRKAGADRVIALPRSVTYEMEAMPPNLRYVSWAAGGKLRYAAAVTALALSGGEARLVVCSHLHLLPFARLLPRRAGCQVLPLIYGREAWNPTPHASANRLSARTEAFISIRRYTAERFKSWAGIPNAQVYYLPNAIEMETFGVGPRRADLVARYGLANRTVIMTAGRIESEPAERNKGFEEVIDALPMLSRQVPDVVYVIMGDGVGRPLLEQRAREIGVADRVIFTGYVSEESKADYYRLADVVAMPGSNPMFDRYPFRFAFLEPLACGVPVVGTQLDDLAERNDPDTHELLIQVDPTNSADITRGILEALSRKRPRISPVLAKFDYPAFEQTVSDIVDDFEQRRYASRRGM